MRTTRRRSLRTVVLAPALAVLVIVLVPVWAVHAAVTRIRTRRQVGSSVDLPRRAADDVAIGVDHVADLAAFRELASSADSTFRVRFHDDSAPYFLYTGDYGNEPDHDEQMTLADFLGMMFGDDDHPDRAGPPDGLCVYRLFGPSDLDGAVGQMLDRIADGLRGVADQPPEKGASGIWIGSRGVVTPLHHDAWPGLLFQTHGTKRVTMFSPRDRTNLYFSAPVRVGSRWSRLPGRSAEADAGTFPRADRAIRHEGELGPGDVLFIPPFWSHEIEALEPNISIPFRFRVATADHLNPGYLRPAYEVLDGNVVRPARQRAHRVVRRARPRATRPTVPS
jgi:hypothetical protein